MKKLFYLAMLMSMPAVYGMSIKDSVEVSALMKVLKVCAVTQTANFGDTVYYPVATLQTQVVSQDFKEDCTIAQERLHAILTKDRNPGNGKTS